MSNHQGSYMLNKILHMPELQILFETLGAEKTQDFILNILKVGRSYDCNNGEILDGLGVRVGVCYYCGKAASSFQEEVCQTCYENDFLPYE